MSIDRGSPESDGHVNRDGPPLPLLQALDTLFYGLSVAAVLVCVSAVVSFAVGGGWNGVKYLLFVVGFLLFGAGSFGMRPKAAWKDDDDDNTSAASDAETRFQAAVQSIPPLRRYELDPEDRLSTGTRVFVSSLFVLGTSLVMEAVFGVAG